MPLYTTQKLKIYNSLSGEKETFVPIHEGSIGMCMYAANGLQQCTPWKRANFYVIDIIFRYLLHLGYKALCTKYY
jgi:cysteinyl-tRNA synthetase